MNIMSLLSGGIVETVGKIADDLITSDEEIAEKENEKLKANLQYQVDMKKYDLAYESELTKRLESDNQGNFLTKSARPVTLYLMLGLIFIMIFGDMLGFSIEDKYVDLVQILSMTAFSFYFGGKSIEAFKHGKVL
ncbi:MAG: 3TM-type holin [Sulfurimonas sp.]|nr:3TM-type holin [Sulfurimonas sp.]